MLTSGLIRLQQGILQAHQLSSQGVDQVFLVLYELVQLYLIVLELNGPNIRGWHPECMTATSGIILGTL